MSNFILMFLAPYFSEKFLINHGIWDECNGDPMNICAEEFDRRNSLAAITASTDKGVKG